MKRALVASALVAISACNWGMRPTEFLPALGPEGARVAVRVAHESVDRTGELYAADSAGVIVRSTRLIRVPWSRVAALDVLHLGADFDVAFGESPDATKRARLATVSRFPQGLSGELLARVLARVNQRSIDQVE